MQQSRRSRFTHFFHVSYLAQNYSSTSDVNVVVQSTDTDSLIIDVGCFQKLLEKHQKLKLWLEMGVETKNKMHCDMSA